MIIFESFLTTFEASIIFEAAGATVKIGSSIKPNHHDKVYLSKSVKSPGYKNTNIFLEDDDFISLKKLIESQSSFFSPENLTKLLHIKNWKR